MSSFANLAPNASLSGASFSAAAFAGLDPAAHSSLAPSPVHGAAAAPGAGLLRAEVQAEARGLSVQAHAERVLQALQAGR